MGSSMTIVHELVIGLKVSPDVMSLFTFGSWSFLDKVVLPFN